MSVYFSFMKNSALNSEKNIDDDMHVSRIM